MTKTKAHEILNQIREGQSMPLSLTNQALERTGDLCGLFSEPLCFDGDEQGSDRPCETHDPYAEVGFSWSRYLDCPTDKGVTQ